MLLFNKSLSKLAISLILRRFFQQSRRIFPDLPMKKVEKKNRGKVDSSVLLGCPWLFEYKSLSRTSLQIAKCSVVIVNFINSLTRLWFFSLAIRCFNWMRMRLVSLIVP